MTSAELNKQIEVSERQRAELLLQQPKRRTGRAYRRMVSKHKFNRLYRIVTSSYVPHAGYTSWSYVDGRHVPTGAYIKYPKNSNRQRWCKKASNARVRKYMDLPNKGNSYRLKIKGAEIKELENGKTELCTSDSCELYPTL